MRARAWNLDSADGIVKGPRMRARASFVAAFLCLALWSGRSSGATAESRLVLIESPANRLSPTATQRLRGAIDEVVAAHRLQRVRSESLPERLLRCELPGCLPQIAATSGATLVLRVEAKYAQESFKLDVELWNSDEGKLIGRESRDCPICDEQDLWGSAALIVQGLLDRAAARSSEPRAVPVQSAPTAAAADPKVSLVPPLATVSPAQAEAGPGLAAYGGLALAVAGLGVLATGIYYLSVDGDPACSQCDRVRDTAKIGLPLAIGGGAAVAAGTGFALWGFWPSAPAVALGPRGVAVAGRF